MTLEDSDLVAVRGLATDPADESVTRSWYRITQLEAAKHPATRRRFLIPVVAAGLVLAVIGVAAVLRPAGLGFAPATSPDAVSALQALAVQAETGTPVVIPDGHLIHVQGDGWAAAFSGADGNTGVIGPQRLELWVDPQGLLVVRNGNGGGAKAESDPPAQEPTTGLRNPTPQWLAALPTDPQALLSLLRQETGQHDKWTVDHQLWDAMGNLYMCGELLLTPQTRAALLLAFTGMSGLTARDTVVNGQQLIAIRHTERGHGEEILFDPTTGRAVGRGSTTSFPEVTLVQPTAGPALDTDVSYVTTWTQTVVANAD